MRRLNYVTQAGYVVQSVISTEMEGFEEFLWHMVDNPTYIDVNWFYTEETTDIWEDEQDNSATVIHNSLQYELGVDRAILYDTKSGRAIEMVFPAVEEVVVPSRDRHALILHRKCAHCGVTKPLNEECFPKKVTKKSGFRGICTKCYERKQHAGN